MLPDRLLFTTSMGVCHFRLISTRGSVGPAVPSNSENAVRSQIWCAVATYVLIAIFEKELKLDDSLYACLQILSVSTLARR